MHISHVIRSRPSVYAVYSLLPATLSELLAKSGLSPEHVRNAVKLLLATKKIYCSAWTQDLQPLLARGMLPNVPRPTPDAVRYVALTRRRRNYMESERQEYQRKYREANKQRRKDYAIANRERINKKRNELMAIKRAIARGQIVAKDEPVQTSWRHT